jgi:hypothetical protein
MVFTLGKKNPAGFRQGMYLPFRLVAVPHHPQPSAEKVGLFTPSPSLTMLKNKYVSKMECILS